jgi:hypothetical protein
LTILSPFEQIVAAINALLLDDDCHLQDTMYTGICHFLRNKPPKNLEVTNGFCTTKPYQICPISSANTWIKAIHETAYIHYVGGSGIDLEDVVLNEADMEYLILDLICCIKKIPSQSTPSTPNITNRRASTSVAGEKLDIKVLFLGPVIGNPNKPGNYIMEDHQDQKTIGTLSPNKISPGEPIKRKTVLHFARNMASADAHYKNKEGQSLVSKKLSVYIHAHWSKKTVSCIKNTEDLWEGINA